MAIRAPPPVQIPTLDPVQVCGSSILSTHRSCHEDPSTLLRFCAGASTNKIHNNGNVRGFTGIATRICSPVPIDKRSPWGANPSSPRRNYVPTPNKCDRSLHEGGNTYHNASRTSKGTTKNQPLSHRATEQKSTVYGKVKTEIAIPRFPSAAHRSQPPETPATRVCTRKAGSSSSSVGRHPTTQPRRASVVNGTFSRSDSTHSSVHVDIKRAGGVNEARKINMNQSKLSSDNKSNIYNGSSSGGSTHRSRNGDIFVKPLSFSSNTTTQNLANQIVVNTASDLRITALEKENLQLREMIDAVMSQISSLQEDNNTMKTQIANQAVAFSVWVDSFNTIVKRSEADHQNNIPDNRDSEHHSCHSAQYEPCHTDGMNRDESPFNVNVYPGESPNDIVSVCDLDKELDGVARCLEMTPQEDTHII
eukprot:Tbor_TRINITY_DN4975_c6_g3::TRINITY_DN4975_c6_g3_i1::g.9955::m.9955